MIWYEILIEILKAIIIVVPLVISLVKHIKQAIKEKNWLRLITFVMDLMEEAEGIYDNGTDRKAWVLAAIKSSAHTIDYPIDIDQVDKLIDDLVNMSKKVNPPKEIIE